MPAICAPKENCSAAAPRSGRGPITMRAPPLVSQDSHRCPVTMPLLSASLFRSPARGVQSLTGLSSASKPLMRSHGWCSVDFTCHKLVSQCIIASFRHIKAVQYLTFASLLRIRGRTSHDRMSVHLHD